MKVSNKGLKTSGFFLFAFLGGFAAQTVMGVMPSFAQAISSYLSLGDNTNSKGIELYVNGGSPAQNFYAADGKIRLQMGTYTAEGERGLPLIALSDNSGNLRMLFRLAGSNEAPVLILKDKQHRDRLVMGLGMSGAEDPFLSIVNEQGQKTNIFGSY